MLIIGYARVSTKDQNLALQRDALNKAGCHEIVEDMVSGSTSKRPGLDAALTRLGHGDKLVVWRLDRLGRSLQHLIETVVGLKDKGCEFLSLSENIDTSSASGQLIFHLLASLSEFERSLLIERTQAGLAAAKRRGQKLGRKPKLTPQQIEHARQLTSSGQQSMKEVARLFRVDRSTVWRALR